MADQISIQPGFSPWQPSSDAELLETYNYYDMPLEGIVGQGGVSYLFRCIEGQTGPESLWAYTLLEEGEAGSLANLKDQPEALEDRLRSLGQRKPLVIAVAREGHGVVSSALIEEPDRFDSLLDAAIEAFRSIEGELEHLRSSPAS